MRTEMCEHACCGHAWAHRDKRNVCGSAVTANEGGKTEVGLTLVLANVLRSVNIHRSIRIHRDAHLADVRVNVAVLESAGKMERIYGLILEWII